MPQNGFMDSNQQFPCRGAANVRGDLPGRTEHGGTVRWHRTRGRGELIDFSANLNPYPPDVPWEPDPSILAEYPDDRYEVLKEVIGRTFHRDTAEITVGNGSIELIRAFSLAVLERGDRVMVDRPTFGEYELAARLAGASCTTDESRAAVRFLCNPNNPTGTLLSRSDVCGLLDRASAHGTYLFLDEAFIELADPRQSLVDVRNEHLFLLRSLTKSFAVPGIRFGYGFGDPDLIARVETVRLPWTVNACAESFAIAAFSRYGELERSRDRIARERAWLCEQLTRLGLPYDPPSANYILISLPLEGATMKERLLNHNILVRDCRSFGLKNHIRVAVRTREDNRELVEALQACLH